MIEASVRTDVQAAPSRPVALVSCVVPHTILGADAISRREHG